MKPHQTSRRKNKAKEWGYRIHDGSAEFRFEFEGALATENVAELEQCWRTAASTMDAKAFVVDLNGLVGIDEAGLQLLRKWHADGAEFVAATRSAQEIVASITGQPVPAQKRERDRPVPSVLRISVALLALFLLATVWAESSRSAVANPAEAAAAAK